MPCAMFLQTSIVTLQRIAFINACAVVIQEDVSQPLMSRMEPLAKTVKTNYRDGTKYLYAVIAIRTITDTRIIISDKSA